MKRYLALLLLLSGCQTAQVTESCHDVYAVVQSPLIDLAPGEVQLAAKAIKIGSYVCGTPAYAAARERVMNWVKARR